MSKFWEDLAEYVIEQLEKQEIEKNKSLIKKLKSFLGNKEKDS